MKPPSPTLDPEEFRQAFLANERQVRIDTGRLACALVFVLMPLGTTLDYFVYPQLWSEFLRLRLLCSVLIVGVWLLHSTPLARKHYPVVGMLIVILPVLFMSWMIYRTQGAASPYYAGLNLVLLAVSAVGHWSMMETYFAVGSVLLLYLLHIGAHAVTSREPVNTGILFNNVYFIVLTGVIVISGNYIFNRLRRREFALRFELDKSRRQLEETNRKLMELDQIKSRFFANISHELRTPLTLLLAPLETLLHRPTEPLPQQSRQLLSTMHTHGMRLLKLINDLLELVRLESGKTELKPEPVGVADFVQGLASSVGHLAADKQIQLQTHLGPGLGCVMADRDKLEKVLLNLVLNALKFTPAGGQVELSATRQADQLVFTVQDNGPGIAAEQLPYVFDRFWQADGSSSRKHPGTGIGLALVKELTELMGGKVSVQSQQGQGARFTVQLPYVPADAPPAQPVPQASGSAADWLADLYRRAELFPAWTASKDSPQVAAPSTGDSRPSVLIAEDEPDMRRFLRSQLEAHYQVIEASDGHQAVELARRHQPDLVLLDLMMPEKDGLQVCREIRGHGPTQNVPIVLLTARADEETKLAALSAGASDFLAKPFSTTELHVRIKNLVESYAYQKRLAQQNRVLERTLHQLRQTQAQLVQSEKLASLGRLSAGIIHEINNPLNFARTGLYVLRQKLGTLAEDRRGEYAETLSDVEEGLHRMQAIVSDLRTFAHPDNGGTEDVPVAEAVSIALRFTSNQWKGRVRVEQAVPADLVVRANRSRLIQVLVNLIQNALDALQTKTFSPPEEPTLSITSSLDGDRCVLRVRDNGPGIRPEHQDKVFDPFFTTKDVGQGLGLGLSLCYSIVQEFGGQISFRTEPGQFCEFTLELPAEPAQADSLVTATRG